MQIIILIVFPYQQMIHLAIWLPCAVAPCHICIQHAATRKCILIAADDDVSSGPPNTNKQSKHLSVTWDIKLWSAANHSSPHRQAASSSFSSSLHSCSVCHVGNRCAQFSALNCDPFQAFYSPWAGSKGGMSIQSFAMILTSFYLIYFIANIAHHKTFHNLDWEPKFSMSTPSPILATHHSKTCFFSYARRARTQFWQNCRIHVVVKSNQNEASSQ